MISAKVWLIYTDLTDELNASGVPKHEKIQSFPKHVCVGEWKKMNLN